MARNSTSKAKKTMADVISMLPFMFSISTKAKRILSISTSCFVGFSTTSSKSTVIPPKQFRKHFASAKTKAYSPNISKKWKVKSWIS